MHALGKKEVKTFKSKHAISFLHAVDGIVAAYKSQPNLKIIFSSAFLVFVAGLFFKISRIEWLILVLTVFIVVIAEMANTAMEATVDLITGEWKEEAKFAKDVTAGGVLLAVVGSIVIGLIIFLPRLISLIEVV